MGLLLANQVQRMQASGGGTLNPPPGQAYRVREFFCVPSTNDDYLTITVDATNILKLRVKGKAGNHCPYPTVQTQQLYENQLGTLLGRLRAAGIDLSIPVASEQILTVARYAEAGEVCLI